MSLVGFRGQNHPQQTLVRGARADVDERGTPPDFFATLDRRFQFTVDAAALPHNAKCERFWTPDEDGLEQDWAGERVWCNPPYSDIGPWVRKAIASECELAVLLLPANRTEQGWWQDHIEPRRDSRRRAGTSVRTEFLRGRLRFLAPGAVRVGPNERPPFGVVLLIVGDEAGQEAAA